MQADNKDSNFSIPPGGGLPYESDGDAPRLALGCKLQILVSLRVLRRESCQYFYPHRYSLGLRVKKYLYYTVLVV